MTTPVNVTQSKTDFLVNAREAFGEALPDWIEIVARESNRTSATAVAARLNYSTAVVSSLCRGNYKGDLGAVEARVRGVYMGELVECPIIGEIARDHCIEEQGRSTSARARFARRCSTPAAPAAPIRASRPKEPRHERHTQQAPAHRHQEAR